MGGGECRRVRAEHRVFKGQPREGGGQSTLSEYKMEGHQITTEPEGATTCINYSAFKFCTHVFFSFFLCFLLLFFSSFL